jgi:RNA polymerase sigma-70 factor (ECF subfamily)
MTVEHAAWREWLAEFARFETRVAYFVALRATGDPAMAEEAVQDAFAELVRRPPHYRGPQMARACLLKVVYRCGLKESKASRRRRRREGVYVDNAIRESRSIMERHTLSAEDRAALARGLDALPADERAPVSFCFELGLSRSEASKVLGVPKATVNLRIKRGLARLRAQLTTAGVSASTMAALGKGLGQLGVPRAPESLHAALVSITTAPPSPGTVGDGVLARASTRVAAKKVTTSALLLNAGAAACLAGALAAGLYAFRSAEVASPTVGDAGRSSAKSDPDAWTVSWTATHGNGPGRTSSGTSIHLETIALAPLGDVYVLGRQTIKSGPHWIRRYDGGTGREAGMWSAGEGVSWHRMAVGPQGDLWAYGTTKNAAADGASPVPWLGRYDASGRLLWSGTHERLLAPDGATRLVSLDGTGATVHALERPHGVDRPALVLVKRDAEGQVLWERTVERATELRPRALVVLSTGHLLLLSVDGAGGKTFSLAAFDATGGQRWLRKLEDVEVPMGLCGDSAGRAFVAGTRERQIWVRAYGARGERLWTWTGGNPSGTRSAYGTHLAVAPEGELWVVGGVPNAGNGRLMDRDIWVGRFDAAGRLLKTWTHSGNANEWGYSHDTALRVAAGRSGGVVVLGREHDRGEGSRMWLRKFSPRAR